MAYHSSYNEKALAKRFIESNGKTIRYVRQLKTWMTYRKSLGIWVYDHSKEEVYTKLDELEHELRAEKKKFIEMDDEISKKRIEKSIYRMGTSRFLKSILEMAQHNRGVTVDAKDLDGDRTMIGCKNGHVNLRTGQLLPKNPSRLITKKVSVKYNPNSADPKVFLKFMSQIMCGDQELVRFMQTVLGYTLTGETREQKMFFLWGPSGSNGKSTLLNLISGILGDYACSTSSSTFTSITEDNNQYYRLAKLRGSRFVSAVELSSRAKMNEVQMKRLTGEDTIVARKPRGDLFEYSPQFKTFMATNHMPTLSSDNATMRRVVIVPFLAHFQNSPSQTLPLDPELPSKLDNEREEIFSWLVEGAQRWYDEGLTIPKACKDALGRFRKASNVVQAFVDECVDEVDAKPDDRPLREFVTVRDLFDAYVTWSEDMGKTPITRGNFASEIRKMGYWNRPVRNHKKQGDPSVRLWMRTSGSNKDAKGLSLRIH